jgi:proteasome lid subunit RPN8/RPN11
VVIRRILAGRSAVSAEAAEPAASGSDPRVPVVDDWQRAADEGAAARESAGAGGAGGAGGASGAVRRGPPWVPASAGLPHALRAEIVEWCRSGLPDEACGILVAERVAEDGGVPTRFVGLRNAAASPYRYLIDPDEQLLVMLRIDDADEVVWAIVHSHVASPPVPSATDVGLAAYPDALYLICSLAEEPPLLRAWTIVDGAVNEVVLEPV